MPYHMEVNAKLEFGPNILPRDDFHMVMVTVVYIRLTSCVAGIAYVLQCSVELVNCSGLVVQTGATT